MLDTRGSPWNVCWYEYPIVDQTEQRRKSMLPLAQSENKTMSSASPLGTALVDLPVFLNELVASQVASQVAQKIREYEQQRERESQLERDQIEQRLERIECNTQRLLLVLQNASRPTSSAEPPNS